tara:strand:+ start:220 stop:747 length:528 start_codon:yes stop_codon:yes gene_type:complete
MQLRETDVVAIATATVLIDTLFLLMNYFNFIFVSRELTSWYTTLGPSAMAMDIIIILSVVALGVYLSRIVVDDDETNIFVALGCVVGLQIVHDVLFYIVFSCMPKSNYIFHIFQKYSKEVSVHAIWSDTLMVVGSLYLAELVVRLPSAMQTYALLMSIYVGLFALYSKPPTPQNE